ncbi:MULTISPECIES: redoxin domain-containing protein [Halorubrum]|uniref:Alkyl hydroperoxide reductase/ thiol specific antioxidant/ Mal allergen n=1 Tax=Halorubrum hochstenium ATCC 700873 TaxID=1227481 RepID=M0FS82_9EURY|nr:MULTISPECIES: redoxin domain-containing protein [Halorubrum]ELZ61414.1 alkyl hydroperoxide reductase/ thiol specific antioxidant/ Mal allergen [Halorubrum hochstenium ATCC 700873]
MPHVGDNAPDFTGSLVDGDIAPFRLSDHLGDEPVVLAFFPAAFSNTCTDEMEALRDGFDRDDCTLFGVSTDLPHALAAYRTQYGLPFALVGDPDHGAIEAYDVIEDFEGYGVETVAQRAVFVIDADGTVTYRWLADNAGQEPDYDELDEAVADAAA